ncbi:MAG: ribonuclease P protein component [Paracoccaceae bacterium]
MVSPALQVLVKRSDFLKAAKAQRKATKSFVLQARQRQPEEARSGVFVGFTCSKKVGNAVARNRAKRRLREIARQIILPQGRDGWDYVLIGRAKNTAIVPMDQMCADLQSALINLHHTSQ